MPHKSEDVKMHTAEETSSSSASSSSGSSDSSDSPNASESYPERNTKAKVESDDDLSLAESDSSQSTAPAKRGRLAKKQRNLKSATEPVPSAEPLSARSLPSAVPSSPPPPLTNVHFELDLSLPYLDQPPVFALPYNSSSSSKHNVRLNAATTQLTQSEAGFRSWYMSTVVDRFENELDHVRQDLEKTRGSNSKTKFELLIAGIASGTGVFDDFDDPVGHEPGSGIQSNSMPHTTKPNEKELVMETLTMKQTCQNQHATPEDTDMQN